MEFVGTTHSELRNPQSAFVAPCWRYGLDYHVAMLLFKNKFMAAIRSGEKTQTIRLWKHRMMRAGQRSYIPGAGYIRIEQVDQVEIADLTDADAVPDGFATADSLRQELSSIYGDKLAAGYQAFRVVFRLVDSGQGTGAS